MRRSTMDDANSRHYAAQQAPATPGSVQGCPTFVILRGHSNNMRQISEFRRGVQIGSNSGCHVTKLLLLPAQTAPADEAFVRRHDPRSIGHDYTVFRDCLRW